ncbi:helix-turn-helix domain-containing protein (plasmid) [Nocardia sp. CA-129566]|uniref:helix-turn-helix domain-containing protein n=1 Tax=Nocardia sp. CA-129566 TaxID=3239976 RepID=UPI003D983B2F
MPIRSEVGTTMHACSDQQKTDSDPSNGDTVARLMRALERRIPQMAAQTPPEDTSPPDAGLRLYTVAQAAEMLAVTEDWYLKQIRARKLPARKAGRAWRVAAQDIRDAIDSMAVPAFTPTRDPSGLSERSRRRFRASRGA